MNEASQRQRSVGRLPACVYSAAPDRHAALTCRHAQNGDRYILGSRKQASDPVCVTSHQPQSPHLPELRGPAGPAAALGIGEQWWAWRHSPALTGLSPQSTRGKRETHQHRNASRDTGSQRHGHTEAAMRERERPASHGMKKDASAPSRRFWAR